MAAITLSISLAEDGLGHRDAPLGHERTSPPRRGRARDRASGVVEAHERLHEAPARAGRGKVLQRTGCQVSASGSDRAYDAPGTLCCRPRGREELPGQRGEPHVLRLGAKHRLGTPMKTAS
jgi:hypothetical protein